ncbi:MAG: hypothetical protein ACRD4P_08550 [Bryobacteraceae bacterium]
MIPELREDFNRRFTPEKYRRFLAELDRRSGTHVKFRNCETPCFFPRTLLDKMVRYGRELIEQLTGDPVYLAAAGRAIPPQYNVPGVDTHPLFVQADFGLDRQLEPKLVEIQGFPSLYGFQPVLAETYRDIYDLDRDLRSEFVEDYWERLRRAIVGDHDPENVVLLEIDPLEQKTLCDFLVTEKHLGIKTVNIRDVYERGNRLYHGETPIHRIYNRAIVDELERKQVKLAFDFRDDIDVEWAGHPNWYFRVSKFSLPWLKHVCVPRTWFLDQVNRLPHNLENYVLKPLYSFAGLGVIVGPTREQIQAVANPSQYILQEKVDFRPVIETPFGKSKAEIRVMYLWQEQLEAMTTIIRTGRGKMMGVDHNRDMEWVGASAGFWRE